MRELLRGKTSAMVYKPPEGKLIEHTGIFEIEVFNPKFPSKRRRAVKKNFSFEAYENYGSPLNSSACVFLHQESSSFIRKEHPWLPPMKGRMPLSADITTFNTPTGANFVAGTISDENQDPTLSGENIIATASRTWTNLQALDLTDAPRDIHALSLMMLTTNPIAIQGLQPFFNPHITMPGLSAGATNGSDVAPAIPRLDRFSDGMIYQISFKNSIIARRLDRPTTNVFIDITNAQMMDLSPDFSTAAYCVPSNQFIYVMGYNTAQSTSILHVKKYDSPETMNLMQSWIIDTSIGGSTAAICFNNISGRFVRALCTEGNGQIHLFGQLGSNAVAMVPNNGPFYISSPNTVKTLPDSMNVIPAEGAVIIPHATNALAAGWNFGRDITSASSTTAASSYHNANLAADKIYCFLDLFEGRYLRYSIYPYNRSSTSAGTCAYESPSASEFLYDIQSEKIIGCRPAIMLISGTSNANDLALRVCDNTGLWSKIEKTQRGARYARSSTPTLRPTGTSFFWEISPTSVDIGGMGTLMAHLKDDGTWPQRISDNDFLKITYNIISKARLIWPVS